MRMGEERPKHLKLENICIVDVNRVLETRFTSGRLLTKVPPRTRSEHENRPLKTRFIGQNRVS